MSDFTYEARAVDKEFFFPDDGKFATLKVGEVVRSDGKVVWSGLGYRNGRSAVLQANRQLPRFRHYLAKYGTCWRDDQDKIKADELAYRNQQLAVRKHISEAAINGSRAAMAGKRAVVPGKFKDVAAVWKAAHAAGKAANLPNQKETA